MSRKSKLIAVFAAAAAVAGVLVVGAVGAGDSGTSDKIAFKTGAHASTPSGGFIDVPGAAIAPNATADGPLVIRFSAEGSVRDLSSG
jgi:hypothetical protein